MSSLVAYEDSEESEDDSLSARHETLLATVQNVTCQANQRSITVCNDSNTTSDPWISAPDPAVFGPLGVITGRSMASSCLDFQQSSCVDVERKCSNVDEESAAACLPSPEGNNVHLQAHGWTPQGSNLVKRHTSASSSVVRPYIPKRQRLSATLELQEPQHEGGQTRESPVLLEASPRLKPYLDQKSSAATAELPRRLLMSLGGHHGPVNTIQWCPVPHLSHLLLSASMDKTFKVWDGAESGRCLRAYTCHSGAVRDACWTPCGRRFLTGSFDNTVVITDAETGQQVVKLDNQFKVMCVALHPSSPDVFLCGGYSSAVKAWDSRSCKTVKVYKAPIQQTLDILFLRGGVDFITSSDCVSMDSADRTLIAWDFQTTAKLSNQIYHERYTCPSLALHPQQDAFVAQTNGNYVAMFSSQQPYRMNKRRRFEGHKHQH
ncbi:WD repeat-containing protein 25 isoform X2 [Gouania willdenowi]|uniref:WD repeat-containing protein 25 isoform X2 n=1 Tax=Gouania willdenowi TaxID=441366 RepID=UPI0010555251|nr:WD repeat-containing protein 25 isoform X2 [Gouania willdenowi]